MKKTLFAAFIVAASIGTSFAQERAVVSVEPAVAKETDAQAAEVRRIREWRQKLVTELNMTEDQVKKMDEMNQAFGERRKSITSNTELTDEVKREKVMALHKAKEAQFAQILTEPQQAKYKELVAVKKKEKEAAAKKEG